MSRCPLSLALLVAAMVATGPRGLQGESPPPPAPLTGAALRGQFDRLFAASFRSLEINRAAHLREHLEAVLNSIRLLLRDPPYPAPDLAPGWRATQRTLGPALMILGVPIGAFDPDVRAEIAARAAGPWTAGAGDPGLRDYAHALEALRSAPLHPDQDDDLTALVLLCYGTSRAGTPVTTFLRSYGEFSTVPAGRSVTDAALALGESAWIIEPDGWPKVLATQRRRLGSASPVWFLAPERAPGASDEAVDAVGVRYRRVAAASGPLGSEEFQLFLEMAEDAVNKLEAAGAFDTSGAPAASRLDAAADSLDRVLPSVMQGAAGAAQLSAMLPRISADFRNQAQELRSGNGAGSADPVTESLSRRWRRVLLADARLEALLQKQVHHEPCTEEETNFIRTFPFDDP